MVDDPLCPASWVAVDLKAIQHNLHAIRQLATRNRFVIPSRRELKNPFQHAAPLLAVIKADAYGHGRNACAHLLEEAGVEYLAVSDVSEGVALREEGIKTPILLFESTLPLQAALMAQYQLTPSVGSWDFALALEAAAKAAKTCLSIHIKVDTGMARLGVWWHEAFDFICQVHDLPHLKVEGLFTHFPVADINHDYTQQQIQHLFDLVVRLDKAGRVIPYIHAANSMGVVGYATQVLNLVRPGLMLYGLYPSAKGAESIDLIPAMSVYSRVIFLKTIKKGQGVSYGHTFVAKKDMPVAVIPIGYNDGYPRALSNKADVLIDGQRCAILGRVTMDQIVVDISRVPNPSLNMPVVIMGPQGDQTITADELAGHANTINYEIICSLGNRLTRVYSGVNI